MPHYHDPRRASKKMILVPMTVEEAQLAVPALNHVGREIFEDSPKGDRLKDASVAVMEVLKATGNDKGVVY